MVVKSKGSVPKIPEKFRFRNYTNLPRMISYNYNPNTNQDNITQLDSCLDDYGSISPIFNQTWIVFPQKTSSLSGIFWFLYTRSRTIPWESTPSLGSQHSMTGKVFLCFKMSLMDTEELLWPKAKAIRFCSTQHGGCLFFVLRTRYVQ